MRAGANEAHALQFKEAGSQEARLAFAQLWTILQKWLVITQTRYAASRGGNS